VTNITRQEAIDRLVELGHTDKLWEMGELTYKLNNVQRELKDIFDNDVTKTSVVVVSRRTGKTYWLVIEAIMQCLKKPNAVVKFLFPQQKDAKTNILPLVRMITEDCPEHLQPIFNSQDKIFNFSNGSQIQLAGSNSGNAESLRGGFADLCIIDEAGFVTDLKYSIRSILSPTIRTTGGRIIMASTPSPDPSHEFITEFMIPYKATGRLKVFTIYDNPNFTPEIIQEIIDDDPLGVESPDFKREYMCEITVDNESTICSEFIHNKDTIVFSNEDEMNTPEYLDFYVGADIGYRDLTVMLFGYYDFKSAQLIILSELVMNGPDMTTEALASEISKLEQIYFIEEGQPVSPYLRIMDNDLKLINDLRQLHSIDFIPTKKDNKEGAINNMKIWMNQGRVKIHER